MNHDIVINQLAVYFLNKSTQTSTSNFQAFIPFLAPIVTFLSAILGWFVSTKLNKKTINSQLDQLKAKQQYEVVFNIFYPKLLEPLVNYYGEAKSKSNKFNLAKIAETIERSKFIIPMLPQQIEEKVNSINNVINSTRTQEEKDRILLEIFETLETLIAEFLGQYKLSI